MIVKVLFLRQPYASWVAEGKKTIETRVWGTQYRGPVLICSSMSGEGPDRGLALCFIDVLHVRMMIDADATAACVERYPKARAWILANRRRLVAPFAIAGTLGLRNRQVDDALLACHPVEASSVQDPSDYLAPRLFDPGVRNPI